MAKDVHNKSKLDPESQRIFDAITKNCYWNKPENPGNFMPGDGVIVFGCVAIMAAITGDYYIALGLGIGAIICLISDIVSYRRRKAAYEETIKQ